MKEKIITDHELIKILIDEIKELKDKNNKQNEKINELIRVNEDKEKKLNYLENKYNILKEEVYNIDDMINKEKYKNEINIIHETDRKWIYNIFGEEFVENNKKI